MLDTDADREKCSLVYNYTNICSSIHMHTQIQIHTLNSTGAGCLFGLNAAFFSLTFWCNSWIDDMGLWSPCRIIRGFLDRFNKEVSLWQGEEASLRKRRMTLMKIEWIWVYVLINHFLCTEI